jgi:hypothetical protein
MRPRENAARKRACGCIPVTEALQPVFPFGSPGEPIVLFDGSATAGGEPVRRLRVSVDMSGAMKVRWVAEEADVRLPLDQTELAFEHPRLGNVSLTASVTRDSGAGTVQHASLGSPRAALDRVVIHWANLPWILPADGLERRAATGRASWSGRWTGQAGEWTLGLDVRPDHAAVMTPDAMAVAANVTHTGELRRTDGVPFTPAAAADAIYMWQVVLSFAFGRWVPPIAPVGYSGPAPVWEQWASWRDSPAFGHLAWCDAHNGDGLREAARQFGAAWQDPDRQDVARYVSHHLIAANDSRMTTEARIMLIQAALEYLSWVVHVLSGARSAREHQARGAVGPAERHLRELLETAKIDPQIPFGLPGLRGYATAGGYADGPAAVTALRNLLVHPKDASEPYRAEGALTDTWRLLGEYGDLVLLNWLGYTGTYLPRTEPGIFAHARRSVPWV